MPNRRSPEKMRERQQKFYEKFGYYKGGTKKYETSSHFQLKKIRPIRPTSPLDSNAKLHLKLKVGRCQVCGWDAFPEILQVHHRDRNSRNNTLENLLVVCPTCHQLIHNELISEPVFIKKESV